MLQDLKATISNTGQPKAANVVATFVHIVARHCEVDLCIVPCCMEYHTKLYLKTTVSHTEL